MCILQLTMGSTRRPLFLTKQPKISDNLSLDAELSNSYSNLIYIGIAGFVSNGKYGRARKGGTPISGVNAFLFLAIALYAIVSAFSCISVHCSFAILSIFKSIRNLLYIIVL